MQTAEFVKLMYKRINTRDVRKAQVTYAWLTTVIPPAALLAFGIALAWIFRGFRPRPA